MALIRTHRVPAALLAGLTLLLPGAVVAQEEIRDHARDAFEALDAEETKRQSPPEDDAAETAKNDADETQAEEPPHPASAATQGGPALPEAADRLHREPGRVERREAPPAANRGEARAPSGVPLSQALGLSTGRAGLTPVGFGFDFVPMVGTSSAMRGGDERRLSLNLIGGLSGGIRGAEVGAAFNLVLRDVRGVQVAGAMNMVGGPVTGAQGAGALNLTFGGLRGVQAAGSFNLVIGAVRGVQAAGSLNLATGAVRGLQAAGAANIAVGTVRGLQAAGAVNVALAVDGGAQVGVLNFSAGDVNGLQLGIVNVAENADAAVGVLNILWGGTWDLEMSGGDTGIYSLAIRNGGRRTHSYLSAGVHPGGKRKVYAAGLGLGVHAKIAEPLQIDFDILGKGLHRGTLDGIGEQDGSLLATARAVLAWELFDGVALVGGPSYNVLVTDQLRPSRFALGNVEQAEEAVELDNGRRGNVFGWPGFEVGLRVGIK